MAIAVDQKVIIGGSGLSFGKSNTERWLGIIVVISSIVLCAAIGVAGWLYYQKNYVIGPKIETARGHIKALNAEEKVAQATQFSVAQPQLKALRTILENHIYSSNILAFVESIVHPRVKFSSINIDTITRSLEVSAQGASLTVLAEQLRIFEQNKDIVNFNMRGFSLSQSGTVDFSISMVFKESLLRK